MADFKWPSNVNSGVTSIDGLTGAVTLVAGTGITITDNSPVAGDITIASSSAGDVTIGTFGSTPNANGLSISGSQVLNMQPADVTHPGGVSILAQVFAGAKTFNDQVLISNGSVSAPGLGLTNSTNTGLYLSGTNELGIAVNGVQALDFIKSTGGGNFGNIGMGGAASVSDNYPLLIQRSITSAGVLMQISNTSTSASAKASYQLVADAGANTGEISVFTAATATAAYAGSMTVRPSDSTLRLSLIGGDLAGGYITTYTGGDYTTAGETLRFNADHSLQFMQQIATPATPATSSAKLYQKSDGRLYQKSAAGTERILGSSDTAGTVTAVSVASANGLAGTSSGGATPALTLSTTITGVLQGNGTAISAATTTGSGSVVLATAPTMTNPVVGTQSQGDASTKAASTSYVDTAVANAVAGLNPAVAVQAATTAASDTSGFTYTHVAGIGDFFTSGNNNAIVIDGFTFTATGQRLLIKNDTQSPSGAFNGVYTVTTLQVVGVSPAILTRALDYDTPSDMNNTGAIPVINGTVNGTTSWVLTSLVVTVGTTPLTFTKFTRNPADYLLVANNLSDVASKSTSFNNLSPMTTSGDIIYGGASGTGTRLAANSTATKEYLQSVSSGIPAWAQVAFADLSGSVAAAQMPALTGDITTSAGTVATTAAATQANISSLSKSTGVAVHGTNTNDNASAGFIGEYVESVISSATDFPATNTYGDLTSISLTAGDWEISLNIDVSAQGGTYTQILSGIGTASGNSSTNLSNGNTIAHIWTPTATSNSSGCVSGYRASLSGTTIYYLKYLSSYTGTAAKATGRLSARRMR